MKCVLNIIDWIRSNTEVSGVGSLRRHEHSQLLVTAHPHCVDEYEPIIL